MQEANGVRYSEKASTSPAFALVVEGYNHLVQEKQVHQFGLGVQWNDRVLYYEVGDEIVSVLVYMYSPASAAYLIRLVYTEPSSQKKGYMKALLKELHSLADEFYDKEPVDRIITEVMTGDQRARALFPKFGLKEQSVAMVEELD